MNDMRTIGEYQVVRSLGKGGMGEVYEVVQARLGTRFALKLFVGTAETSSETRARFEAEGRLLARLNHPRIVRVFDYGVDDETGAPYFVMELVLTAEGDVQTLADALEAGVDEEMVGAWHDDLRTGLNYIHAHGVVHRDLKLENVLVGPDGHAVLTDFGISRIFQTEDAASPMVDPVQTILRVADGKRLVMGSLGYLAPELEMGVDASEASDWYALGVLDYRLLTGLWCDARTDILAALESYDPVWLQIMPKLLHANPAGRACLSYAEEKRRRTEHEVVRLERACETAARRVRWVWGAALALACLAAGVSIWTALSFRAPRTPAFPELSAILPPLTEQRTPEQIASVKDAQALVLVLLQRVRNGEWTVLGLENRLYELARAIEDDTLRDQVAEDHGLENCMALDTLEAEECAYTNLVHVLDQAVEKLKTRR